MKKYCKVCKSWSDNSECCSEYTETVFEYNALKDEIIEDNKDLLSNLTDKGLKYDTGKEMVSLLPPDALMELGKVMSYGAMKYAKHNWKNGISYHRLLDAAGRHMLKFQSSIRPDFDEESGLHHLAHAAVNLLMLLQFELENRQDLDDRFKKEIT